MKTLVLMMLFALSVPAFGLTSPDLQGVISRAKSTDLIPVDIVLKEQMDSRVLTDAVKDLPKPQRRAMVAQILTAFSEEHQRDVMAYLRAMEKQGKVTDIKSFWLSNAMYCQATIEVIEALDQNAQVYYVDYDLKPIELERPAYHPALPSREIAWGVSKVNAPAVWALGYTGAGVVVGHVDTGVNYNHVDLADHLWTDANYPNHGWNFELSTNDPMDVSGHGTHTAGSVASDGTAGSQCGVAPDAQILGCRVRTVADSVAEWQVFDAWQFCISPPLSPTHGADAMTMSLGWQISWNPHQATWRTNANTVGAAGIIQCVAAGNESGIAPPNSCRCPGNVPSPWRHPQNGATGAQSNIISIGATDINDAIGSFSSLGPVTWQTIAPFNDYTYPPGLTKPDVCAPGVNIKSLDYASNNGYLDGWDGTSMATPHAAGVVALMLQKNPFLTQVVVDSILQVTAVDLGAAGKDNTFGSGRIDALAAVNATPYPNTPFTPTIISPFDYARLPTVTPTFKLMTIDPQGDPVLYRIYWSTDTAFTTKDSATTGQYASGSVASYTLPVSLTNGITYWWKVIATDNTGSGVWSSATPRRSFTIGLSLPASTCSWFQTTGAQFLSCTYSMTQQQGDSIVLRPVGYIEDTIYFADFESGMPGGWTVVNGNGDSYYWTVGTTGDLGSYTPPSPGTAYAYYSDDDAGSGVINNNEELISPVMGVPAAAANLRISYGYGFMVWETGEVYRAKCRRKTGGAWGSWTNIATYTASGNGTASIDLVSFLPADSVQFEWFYSDSTAASHWGYACATDNVTLFYSYTYTNNSGTVAGPQVTFSNLSQTYPRTIWGNAVWRKATAGDSIGLQVEYYNGSIWQLIPNSLIPGNTTGKFTTLAVDSLKLNLVTDTVTYNRLRLKALLYRKTKDSPGEPALLDWELGNLAGLVGIAETEGLTGLDAGFGLNIYPNITKNVVRISYSVGRNAENVALKVYDATGRVVKSFALSPSSATQYGGLAQRIVWQGTDDAGRSVPAGVYFVKLEAGDQQAVQKAVLLR